MANKKFDVYNIQGAFNSASVQIDREWTMKSVRHKLQDTADEIDYWDSWTKAQKEKYRNGDKE